MRQAGSGVTGEERVRAIVAEHRTRPGPLLPVLHALQHEFGRIDAAAVRTVADELNLSRADVHGVVSFYSDFRSDPVEAVHVRVCRGEACQALGAEQLYDAATDAAGGDVSVEQVFCFGNCALGPTVEVNGRLRGRTGPQDLAAAIAAARTAS
ncbi:NADH-quinone oxidoreductase subunit NuoE family protein [Pseudonocardia dioxanivorans]|jgi:formate dehydrogenase subunit gamma|uniref:NADH-quinone oxidoreductase subunit NuoE family protein n=1 Tax=Pseudonocardia dioxanivorans TaxID=240495 RepID=UPI000CD2643D|nr:NAD(P)H-dependent oxidoreductase subunit E [Pseudonocardia dioxanivorans]